MSGSQELQARLKDFFSFSKQEISGLVVAILVTAFIFTFRDWGEDVFSVFIGLQNFFAIVLIVGFSFLFRLSCQKIYALSSGYKAEFKIWWTGLIIALVVAFISVGYVPLVLIGGMVASFMVKQRLGEMRYGFSNTDNAVMSLWGVLGNMIAAILFALALYFFPDSYLFTKGLILNLIMGFCALLPLPQLDGLKIYFGSRFLYYIGITTVILGSVLLLSKTKIGLILAIVIGTVAAITYLLTRSGE